MMKKKVASVDEEDDDWEALHQKHDDEDDVFCGSNFSAVFRRQLRS